MYVPRWGHSDVPGTHSECPPRGCARRCPDVKLPQYRGTRSRGSVGTRWWSRSRAPLSAETMSQRRVLTSSLDRECESCQGLGGEPRNRRARAASAPGRHGVTARISARGKASTALGQACTGGVDLCRGTRVRPGLARFLELDQRRGLTATVRCDDCDDLSGCSSRCRCLATGNPCGGSFDDRATGGVTVDNTSTHTFEVDRSTGQSRSSSEHRSCHHAWPHPGPHHGHHDGEREPERAHRQP